jgi:hypothetical protein
MSILKQRRIKMSAQTYVIYDKYNGHIVCDIKDNYRIFDNAVKAEQYIRDKNLNQIDFVVERSDKFDKGTVKEIQSIKI